MKRCVNFLIAAVVVCGLSAFTISTAFATMNPLEITAPTQSLYWCLTKNYDNKNQSPWVDALYTTGNYGNTFNAGSATNINIAYGMEGVSYAKICGVNGDSDITWGNIPNNANWVCSGWNKAPSSDYASLVFHEGARRYNNGSGNQQFSWRIIESH